MICRRCLKHTATSLNGTGDIPACAECIALTADELSRVRPIFDAMIAGGIQRPEANAVMTAYLDSLKPRTQ